MVPSSFVVDERFLVRHKGLEQSHWLEVRQESLNRLQVERDRFECDLHSRVAVELAEDVALADDEVSELIKHSATIRRLDCSNSRYTVGISLYVVYALIGQ